MLPAKIHQDFKSLYDEALKARYDKYWDNPRTNSLGGVEHPDDFEQNAWSIQAFKEAASKLGCHIQGTRNTEDDCYHLVRWIAVHPKHGFIAGLEFIDCVCGGHGPRNAELFWPQGQGEVPS